MQIMQICLKTKTLDIMSSGSIIAKPSTGMQGSNHAHPTTGIQGNNHTHPTCQMRPSIVRRLRIWCNLHPSPNNNTNTTLLPAEQQFGMEMERLKQMKQLLSVLQSALEHVVDNMDSKDGVIMVMGNNIEKTTQMSNSVILIILLQKLIHQMNGIAMLYCVFYIITNNKHHRGATSTKLHKYMSYYKISIMDVWKRRHTLCLFLEITLNHSTRHIYLYHQTRNQEVS